MRAPRFRMTSPFREGGSVFPSYDTLLDRPVVLRRLGPGKEAEWTADVRRRVKTSTATARTPVIHDLVEIDRTWWIVEEHVHGRSLAEFTGIGTLGEKVDAVEDALGGLAELHGSGHAHGAPDISKVLLNAHRGAATLVGAQPPAVDLAAAQRADLRQFGASARRVLIGGADAGDAATRNGNEVVARHFGSWLDDAESADASRQPADAVIALAAYKRRAERVTPAERAMLVDTRKARPAQEANRRWWIAAAIAIVVVVILYAAYT